MFCTMMPLACIFSTSHWGGTPTAHTKSLAPDSTMMSASSGKWPSV